MKIKSTRYIYPPRPQSAIPREAANQYADYGWIAQLKYNDARALVKYLPSPTGNANDVPVELWGRHGEKFRNYTTPEHLITELREVHKKLGLNPNEWSLLDGGLLDFKHEAIRDTIIIWDILVKDGDHLTGTTYQSRYDIIAAITNGDWYYHPPHGKHEPLNLGRRITDNIFMPINWPADTWDEAWDLVTRANAPYIEKGKGPVLEGLVFKDSEGILENAWKEQNNSAWLGRSRVTTGRHAF